eukprot:364975-Chlamydomonas_euryale.AAC.5
MLIFGASRSKHACPLRCCANASTSFTARTRVRKCDTQPCPHSGLCPHTPSIPVTPRVAHQLVRAPPLCVAAGGGPGRPRDIPHHGQLLGHHLQPVSACCVEPEPWQG